MLLACSPAKNCCLSPTPSWAENCSTQHQINFPPVRANKTDHAQAGSGDEVNLRAAIIKIPALQLTGVAPERTLNESLHIRDRVWKPEESLQRKPQCHRSAAFLFAPQVLAARWEGVSPAGSRERFPVFQPVESPPGLEASAAVFETEPLGGHPWLKSPVALSRAPAWHVA
jgi:hypothetical protein